jgi:hypothetical protein
MLDSMFMSFCLLANLLVIAGDGQTLANSGQAACGDKVHQGQSSYAPSTLFCDSQAYNLLHAHQT